MDTRVQDMTDDEIDAEIVSRITPRAQKIQKIIMMAFMHRMTEKDVPRIQASLARVTDRHDLEWTGDLGRWGYCEIWQVE